MRQRVRSWDAESEYHIPLSIERMRDELQGLYGKHALITSVSVVFVPDEKLTIIWPYRKMYRKAHYLVTAVYTITEFDR